MGKPENAGKTSKEVSDTKKIIIARVKSIPGINKAALTEKGAS
jgi:hypothetical protein